MLSKYLKISLENEIEILLDIKMMLEINKKEALGIVNEFIDNKKSILKEIEDKLDLREYLKILKNNPIYIDEETIKEEINIEKSFKKKKNAP